MKLSELLIDDWIALPLEAIDLEGALRELLAGLPRAGLLDGERAPALARELASGKAGEVVRVNDEVIVVLARVEGLAELSMTLGVAPDPFAVAVEGKPPGTARAVVLLMTPRALQPLRAEMVPTLIRALRDEERTRKLLAAGSPVEVRALTELMETELRERHLVSDALVPVRYRIYPDTPLTEVVDLMVRRGLRAVPVVGERYEVLGLITSGDALKHLLPRRRSPEGEAEPAVPERTLRARDVMSRSVLCVSEEQPLIEAASMMVNRDVEQLPVVREGELVGFLTRDAILRLLFTGTRDETQ